VLDKLHHETMSHTSMQRLLQGDVGCGKTIVAFLSMLQVNLSGYQTAIMAPTDVLARQHYENFKKLLETLDLEDTIPLVLLTGSLKSKERKEALWQLETQMNCLVVGTHALFQEAVVYGNLGYIVIDEQHRFGVKQREMLCKKNHNPHLLVMSATPIPRTLAMILYGDMDISTIHEMPANRIPIKNCVIKSSKRPTAYQFIEKELKNGHQAYVICHLIEESEDSEYENVISYHEKLCAFFQNKYHISILHGKMSADQKESIMTAYSKHEIDILVSTTVIEVGIDVPNSTVILIEDAQAFGLSQLHQLRGRVGRSNLQSYCIMIDSSKGSEENPRLQICNHSNDGFEIAEKDLDLRGPGDFFGIRQSGEMNFSLGDIYQDASILQDVSEDVQLYLQMPSSNSESFLNSLFAKQTFVL
ncbi:MAG: ATP-dependent DNA helicase RecG, partial [Lachnospiraceae bacterium]|nr:ATP-dependent DNA helicase RecG [Lachnospiraceae bacterium]